MSNRFFLRKSRVYSVAHLVSLAILILGALLDFKHSIIVWPLFCLFGFLLYLKFEYKAILSLKSFVSCIPFIFSLIASTWFIAGSYDLHLLGYNKIWSFYAALHANFLGWILIGCLAFLAKQNSPWSSWYAMASYLCFIFFLFIALGINGLPYAKPIGVIGISMTILFSLGLYFFRLTNNKSSRYLSGISFFGLIFSMTLAILHEFSSLTLVRFLEAPIMVSVHGLINALVVLPCFYLAIEIQSRTKSKF